MNETKQFEIKTEVKNSSDVTLSLGRISELSRKPGRNSRYSWSDKTMSEVVGIAIAAK